MQSEDQLYFKIMLQWPMIYINITFYNVNNKTDNKV